MTVKCDWIQDAIGRLMARYGHCISAWMDAFFHPSAFVVPCIYMLLPGHRLQPRARLQMVVTNISLLAFFSCLDLI
jgi:hypothetical protein